MPLAYGGHIQTLSDAQRIFNLGFEKICLQRSIYRDPYLLKEFVAEFGSQSIMVSVDLKRKLFSDQYSVLDRFSLLSKHYRNNPVEFISFLSSLGVGEFLVTIMDLKVLVVV